MIFFQIFKDREAKILRTPVKIELFFYYYYINLIFKRIFGEITLFSKTKHLQGYRIFGKIFKILSLKPTIIKEKIIIILRFIAKDTLD